MMSENSLFPLQNETSTSTTQQYNTRLPLGVKSVATYFIFSFIFALVCTLIMPVSKYAELKERPGAQKMGATMREVVIQVLYLSCGIGLFRRRAWARKLGLLVLIVDTYYGAYACGWGFAGGRPNSNVLIISFLVIGTWNAFWFFLLYHRSSAQALS
jgi:hypothetical protein